MGKKKGKTMSYNQDPFAPNGSEMMQMQIHANVVVKGAFDTGLIKSEEDLNKWTFIATNNFAKHMTVLPIEQTAIQEFALDLTNAKNKDERQQIMHAFKNKFISKKSKEIARDVAIASKKEQAT